MVAIVTVYTHMGAQEHGEIMDMCIDRGSELCMVVSLPGEGRVFE